MSDLQNDEIIVITAARPGLWLRKKLSPGRWAKGLFSDYAEKLKIMDKVDEEIYQWVKELEYLMKKLKKLKGHKARKTVDAAVLLGAINKRLQQIVAAGEEVEQVHEEKIREFESNYEFDFDVEEYLSEESPFGLSDKEREALKKELREKHAGFVDDLKRRFLAYRLETKRSKDRKKAINKLIELAERTVESVKERLKRMEKAVGSGQIGEYIDDLKHISRLQSKFDDKFTSIYSEHLAEIVDPILEQYKQKAKEPQTVEVEEGQVQEAPASDEPEAQPEQQPDVVPTGPGLDQPLPQDVEGPSGQPEAVVEIENQPYTVDILEEVDIDPTPGRRKKKEPTPEAPGIIPEAPEEPEIGYMGGGPELKPGESFKGIRGPKEKIPQWLQEQITHKKEVARQLREHEEQQKKRLEKRKQAPKPKDPRLFQYRMVYEPQDLPSFEREKAPELPEYPLPQAGGLTQSELKPGQEETTASLISDFEKFSNNPGLMAAMIAKYSEKFEDIDPDKSLELLSIAERILADVEE